MSKVYADRPLRLFMGEGGTCQNHPQLALKCLIEKSMNSVTDVLASVIIEEFDIMDRHEGNGTQVGPEAKEKLIVARDFVGYDFLSLHTTTGEVEGSRTPAFSMGLCAHSFREQ